MTPEQTKSAYQLVCLVILALLLAGCGIAPPGPNERELAAQKELEQRKQEHKDRHEAVIYGELETFCAVWPRNPNAPFMSTDGQMNRICENLNNERIPE